jgi:hypothetical protein
MNKVKLRRGLVSIHLYLAALLAPAFILMAITGSLYLAGVQGETVETEIAVPQGYVLTNENPELEAEVRRFIADEELGIDFDYIRGRGDSFMTRPTSRLHLRFENGETGTTAKLVQPDMLSALTELHKGHGPQIFRYYGIVMGVALFFVVMGGLVVGLLAPAYRRPTILASAAGTLVFAYLAFWA